MRSNYPGKSYKLNDLLAEVTRFFTIKGFVVSARESDTEHVISVQAGESAGTKILDVYVAGDASGSLLVSFAASSEGSLAIRNSALPSLLGGGFLTLKWQKSAEISERLETEFWEMVDKFMVSS
jgi:hypothetical protein